jgi:ABC-type branched-subunit amino acid transport system substrate-binding protein
MSGRWRHLLLACLALALPPAAGAAEVGEKEIVIGMSAAFTGPSRALGIELYRGSRAYLDHINGQGGVHGRRVVVKAYDDGYDPPRAIANTIRLIEDDGVFLLFNYVGTPTVTRVLPLLRQFSGEDVFLFFPFTGAEPHRQSPYTDYVFNLRASYFNETEGLVSHFVDIGRSEIAVFYQADAYGRSGWEGVRNALERHGLSINGEASYRRGTGFGASFQRQVEILKATNPKAIISVCSYEACAGLIRDARASGWDVPIANLSFVASEAMAALLLGGSGAGDNTQNLINAQVVPSYEDLSLPAVVEYRELMDGFGDAIPDAAGDTDYQPLSYSFVGFEGYLNARLLVEILRGLGPDPAKERIRESVEGLSKIDLGIDRQVFFGPNRHQASDAVYYTTLVDGVFVPLTDWQQWSVTQP